MRLLGESVDGGNFLFELLTKKPQGHNSFAKVVYLAKKLTQRVFQRCISQFYSKDVMNQVID